MEHVMYFLCSIGLFLLSTTVMFFYIVWDELKDPDIMEDDYLNMDD